MNRIIAMQCWRMSAYARARGIAASGVVVLCLAVQGCASAEAPATQTVRVRTPGCAAARCTLSNDRGSWQIARTPGSVTVLVSREPLMVRCDTEGAALASTKATMTQPDTSGVGGAVGGVAGGAVAGAALGGTALAFIPPLGVAAVVTGALVGGVAGNAAEAHSQPIRYPGLISLPMSCPVTGDPKSAGGVPQGIGLTVRGLTPSEARAQGLDKRTAVLVLAVDAKGVASESGLRVGDVILALDGKDLADAADLEERLFDLPPAAPLNLRIWRDGLIVDIVLARPAKERP